MNTEECEPTGDTENTEDDDATEDGVVLCENSESNEDMLKGVLVGYLDIVAKRVCVAEGTGLTVETDPPESATWAAATLCATEESEEIVPAA